MIDIRIKTNPSPAFLILVAGACLLLPGMCGTTRPMHFEILEIVPAISMLIALLISMAAFKNARCPQM